MDVALLIAAIVVAILTIVCSFYFYLYWSHEEDKYNGWYGIITVVLGMSLAIWLVILPAFDTMNTSSGGDTLPMEIIWQVAAMAIIVFLAVLIPMAVFLYESEGESIGCMKQFCGAVGYTVVAAVVFTLLAYLMFATIGYAEIPTPVYYATLETYVEGTIPTTSTGALLDTVDIKIRPSFFVYIIGIISFVGYILFTVFGAVGIVALPMDLINEFRKRPHPMPDDEFAQWQLFFRDRSARLMQILNVRPSSLLKTSPLPLSLPYVFNFLPLPLTPGLQTGGL
ncbi:LMBR1-like membrane protein [Kipferlia bialata]|uniref:LMBR1-like membrane protein n=1 Tax=Kipferlia bialata TaxID=797122 RepID=A0A9K3GM83_9EUKA|nr:LMBR1-like membrane protein [Kipferlia bialata]|eukprot:g11341.t1